MQKEDKTIVISSHQLSELERFADHVGVIHRGKMLLSGRMDELIERHRQYDVELLNGKVPSGEGIRILKQDGSRVRLLVDSTVASEADLNRMKCEVVSQSPMTLEEIFVALVTK
jgi:ABC-2 type transport system ATP-binding protein